MKRFAHDGYDMDEATGELAEVIEGAIADVVGNSPLVRMTADHAARAVMAHLDYVHQVRPDPAEPT